MEKTISREGDDYTFRFGQREVETFCNGRATGSFDLTLDEMKRFESVLNANDSDTAFAVLVE